MNALNRRRYMGNKGLPYDAEIEYLQSTGTACIDTGIIPTLSYSVEMEFKWVSPFSSADASANLFGSINGWNNNGFCIVYTHQSNRKDFYNCWGNNFQESKNTDLSYLLDSWHTLTFTNKKTLIDGTQIGKTSTGTGDPVRSVYLFCARNWASGNYYGIGTTKQIRSFKMYDASSNLVIDLIPVRKGTIGYMYDKVSGELFGNSGTGNFTLGQDIVPIEYLRGTGQQCIDTGITYNSNITIEASVMNTSTASGYYLFGIYYKSSNDTAYRWAVNVNGTSFALHFGTTTNTSVSGFSRDVWHTIQADYRGLKVDLNNWVYSSAAPFTTENIDVSIALFGRHDVTYDGVTDDFVVMRDCFYQYFKIFDNGTLVRDFIPVRVGQTGYMYDKISRTLFGNVGTGDFILGPDKN